MKNPVTIFGATALGRAAKEIFESNDIVVYGFLDDDEKLHNTEIDDVAVMGSTEDDGYLKFIGKKSEAFVAVDDNDLRKGIVKMLKERRKVMPTNAIHQSSEISKSAHIGHGNLINMGARVGSNAKVGNHCILHTNSVVDFNAELGDFVQVGAGSAINAEAKIEDEAFIGTGVTIVAGISIGKGARVGAGSVVIADVGPGETVFGNPAQKVDR